MISAPVSRTASGFIALTVAAVPTGMKAGVRISPRRMAIRPVRTLPSVASMLKANRVTRRSETVDEREAREGVGCDRAGRRIAVVIDLIRQARSQPVAHLGLQSRHQIERGVSRIHEHRSLTAGFGDHVA